MLPLHVDIEKARFAFDNACNALHSLIGIKFNTDINMPEFNFHARCFCESFLNICKLVRYKRPSNWVNIIFSSNEDITKNHTYKAHWNAAKDYITDLLSRIEKPSTQTNFIIEVDRVFYDFLPLLSKIKSDFNFYDIKIPSGRRNMELSAKTAWTNGYLLFHDILNKNTYPYFFFGITNFSVRQSIEIAGREIFGLASIQNENGDAQYLSMIAWEFLQSCKGRNIKLPFEVGKVVTVYKWANRFTHGGINSSCYITFAALQINESIFVADTVILISPEGEELGVRHPRVVIKDHSALRAEFQSFLDAIRIEQGKTKWIAFWRKNNFAKVISDDEFGKSDCC